MIRSAVGAACLTALVGVLSPSGAGSPSALLGSTLASVSKTVGQPARIPFGTTKLGAALPTSRLSLDVVLQPRNPAALSKFALAVSTPGNRLYRQFLAAGQFSAVFGPASSTVSEVTAALRRLGLSTGTITSNHLIIPVSTTVGAAERAFRVSLNNYRLPSGRVAIANADAPRLPADVARSVEAVVGLDNLSLSEPGTAGGLPPARAPKAAKAAPAHRTTVTHSPRATGPVPCAAVKTAAAKDTSWTEDQLAKAYSLPTLYARGDLGAGATIALYELTDYSSADIASFQSCYGTSTAITNVPVDGGTTSSAGAGEAELDIEVVLGLAPKASLLVYEAPNSTSAALDEYNTIVTKDKAQVISSSWGQCELFLGSSTAKAENTIFQQAATQGQSMISIPGDEGSEGCLPNDFGVLGASLGSGADSTGIAVDPSDQTAYVANFGNGTVSVVSELSLQVVATINLGAGSEPVGVAVDPTTHKVFVTAFAANGIAVISGSTCNASTKSNCGFTAVSTEAGSGPVEIAVNPTTKTVYFAASGFGQVGVLSETSLKIVDGAAGGSGTFGVAVDVTTDQVFFTAANDDTLGEFSGATCDAATITGCPTSVSGVTVGLDPTYVAVDAALGRVYVSNTHSSTVSVVTASTGSVVGTVSLEPVVAGPEGLAVSPSGKALLVAGSTASANGRPTGIAVISLATDTLTSLLAAGKSAADVASDPSIDAAAVADAGDGAMIAIPLVLDPWDPGGQPFVTGVGGTDLTALGPKPTEAVWDEHLDPNTLTPAGAGGGGISVDFPIPTYQSAPGVHNPDSSGTPCGDTTGICREVPDVSASADPAHGYEVFEQGSFVAIGGTSAAAPLWAAITGLLDVQQGTLHKVGFLNPALYKLVSAGKPIVNDITVGNNDYTTTANGTFPATKGYDMATGLGTPIGTGLSQFLGANPLPTVTALSPKSGGPVGGTHVVITGTGMLWTSAVKFGAKAAKSFTIVSPTEVIAVSPAGTGSVTVTVTTPGGTSKASAGSKFTY